MFNIYYGLACGGAIKILDPRRHWAVEAYVPFWTKESEAGSGICLSLFGVIFPETTACSYNHIHVYVQIKNAAFWLFFT